MSNLTLADAPKNLSLAEKLAWLNKARMNPASIQAPAHATEIKEGAEPVPEVAVAPTPMTMAEKVAAAMAARKAATAQGVAPAIGATVMPQISALEAAAKKVQTKSAIGSYAFSPESAEGVKQLELDPAEIEAKLAQWDLAIETNNPEAKTLLQEINSLLRSYDELAYLLSEEQIGVVVSGALALAGTEVATLNATKSKTTTRAANSSMAADDF